MLFPFSRPHVRIASMMTWSWWVCRKSSKGRSNCNQVSEVYAFQYFNYADRCHDRIGNYFGEVVAGL